MRSTRTPSPAVQAGERRAGLVLVGAGGVAVAVVAEPARLHHQGPAQLAAGGGEVLRAIDHQEGGGREAGDGEQVLLEGLVLHERRADAGPGRTGVPAASTAARAAASTNSFSSVTTPTAAPRRATSSASFQSPSTRPAAIGPAGSSARPSTATRRPSGQAARQVIRASCPAPAMPTSVRRRRTVSAGVRPDSQRPNNTLTRGSRNRRRPSIASTTPRAAPRRSAPRATPTGPDARLRGRVPVLAEPPDPARRRAAPSAEEHRRGRATTFASWDRRAGATATPASSTRTGCAQIRVTLARGRYTFLCTVSHHAKKGMKFTVAVTRRPRG